MFKSNLFRNIASLILIIIFFEPKASFSQLRRVGEIFPWAYGIGSSVEWYVSCATVYGDVWWWNDYKLTTQHGSDETSSTTGNVMINPGFHACDSWDDEDDPVVSYGYYKFVFHFPRPINPKVFYLDIRDADYSENYYGSPDLDIRWNESNDRFEYKNSLTEPDWEELCDNWESVKIWELFGITDGNENKEVFQPTEPLDFECTNPDSTGKNPNFDWDAPTDPTGVNFDYKIYRREGGDPYSCIAEEITSTDWTDETVTIETTGSWFSYYATAYKKNKSSESKKSDIATIKGQNSAKPIAEQLDNSTQQITDQTQNNLNVYNFPNPFNPSTNISYYLPSGGYIQLSVYNISGQKIAELSNGYKYSGEYSVNFDAHALAGGIYFIHLQFGNRQITKKILLFK